MASITLRLSERVDARGKSEILLRFIATREHTFRGKTGIFINPARWHAEEQRPIIRKLATPEQRELMKVKADIEGLTMHILDEYERADKRRIGRDWLKDTVDSYWHPRGDEDCEFFARYAHFIETHKVCEARREQFRVIYRTLQRFEQVRGQDIRFCDIDADFLVDFEEFLRQEHELCTQRRYRSIYQDMQGKSRPRERSQNTITGTMKKLRTFILKCVDDGLIQENPFRKYQMSDEIYGTPFYLTIEERDRVARCNLSRHPELAVQRDIFVFQCLTGPRYGDLQNLKKSDIVDGVLQYIPNKTKDSGRIGLLSVPLTQQARDIVHRYAWMRGQKLLPFISLDKYNDAVKRIVMAARVNRYVSVLNPLTRREEKHKLWEVATSHMARRTFVGNLYKKVKDQNLISSMSGHAEGSRAFARYRDIDIDIKKDVVDLLENE